MIISSLFADVIQRINYFFPIEMEDYFKKDIDDREILDSFNLSLIARILNNIVLFTEEEMRHLDQL